MIAESLRIFDPSVPGNEAEGICLHQAWALTRERIGWGLARRCARLDTPPAERSPTTWQHVEKQLNAAALGKVETIDVAVPLRMVLMMEGV
jgi:hypothetical protein